MAVEVRDPDEDTKKSCWICDRERVELGRVLERLRDRELPGDGLAWSVPLDPSKTPGDV